MQRPDRSYFIVNALYCGAWSFLTPVYTIFLLGLGLDLFEINVILAVYLLCTFACEVPTGALADLAGRRACFLLSCVLRSLAFLLYWSASGFRDCLVAEVLDAIGTTLASGALEAWVVDSTSARSGERVGGRLFARAQLLATPVMMLAGLLGAYLADRDLALPWPAGAFMFGLAGVVAVFLMQEPPRNKVHQTRTVRAWWSSARSGVLLVSRDPVMRLICLLVAASSFALMPAWHYWPARLQGLSGQGHWVLGWAWCFISLAGMGGSALASVLPLGFRRDRLLCVAWAWRAVMLAAGGLLSGFWPSLASILCMQAVWGISEPTLQGWMNEHAEEGLRATVLSVRSMAFTLGGGVGLLALGLVGRSHGIESVWVVSAVLLMVVAPGFLLLGAAPRTTPR